VTVGLSSGAYLLAELRPIDWRVLLPWVFALLVIVAIVAMVRWGTDGESKTGVLTLALVTVSVANAVVMVFVGEPGSWWRFPVSAIVLVLALATTSTQWTRSSVRWLAVVAVLLLGALTISIGHQQLQRDPAALASKNVQDAAAKLAAIESRAGELGTASQQALNDLDKKLENLPATGFSKAATTFRSALNAVNTSDLDEGLKAPKADVARSYNANTANEVEVAARTSLDHAEKAKRAALAAAEAKPDGVTTAIKEVCALVPADLRKNCPQTLPSAEGTLSVKVAALNLAIAKYEEASLGREEDASAAKSAADALVAAQADAANPRTNESPLTALQRGGDSIAQSISGIDNTNLALEAFGWAVLAALAITLWRRIERASATRMAGPVKFGVITTVDPTATTSSTPAEATANTATAASAPTTTAAPTYAEGKDEQEAAFSAALLENLPEASAVPGATALDSLTDLSALAGPAGTTIGKVLGSLKDIVAKPGGCNVSAEVIAPSAAEARWRVQVRIGDEWSGQQIAVGTLTGPTPVAAASAAGYWAAAVLLARSPRIPGWERWDRRSAEALAVARHLPPFDVSTLENALAKAPTSGTLLEQLANLYDEAGRHREAMAMHARAVAIHPRFFIAAYRLAVSAWMLSKAVDEQWTDRPTSEKTRIAGELTRAAVALDCTVETASLHGDAAAAQSAFKALARAIFGRLKDDTTRPQAIRKTLRRSERDQWLPIARSIGKFSPLTRAEWLVRSARLPLVPADLSKVEDLAEDSRSWWQISYNLACYYARQPDYGTACRWLEIALERPGSEQMAGGWIEQDPDLHDLHSLPRFRWVADQVKVNTEAKAND
jgi:tetratricopeptide (TPR) repeat protein